MEGAWPPKTAGRRCCYRAAWKTGFAALSVANWKYGVVPTHATGRFGAVEIMTHCGQTRFLSNLEAAPLWVRGRALDAAVAASSWPQPGLVDRFTDRVVVCIIHT
jgi:hypothetical protein